MKQNHVWPDLPYDAFKSTAHLLHMGTQVLGKLKLHTPFEPHWANVILHLTSRGLTTGPIPFVQETFNVDMDFIEHEIIISTSWGQIEKFALASMSVAQFTQKLFKLLDKLRIALDINYMPQEVSSPIPFHKDTEKRHYDHKLANAWWRILLSSYRVMLQYHARFNGETPPIGLMWGTFDLRDARYNGIPVATKGAFSKYIERNAMNEEQVEIGWWHGNEKYPEAAYYSFTYPKPKQIENANIEPRAAHWEESLGEFILDYKMIQNSADPEKDLLSFFESTYRAGANRAHWDPKLITLGRPI